MDRDVTHEIYYMDRSEAEVHILFCVILYSMFTNLSDDMFFVIVYLRPKRVLTKSGRKHYIDRARSIYCYCDRLANKDK